MLYKACLCCGSDKIIYDAVVENDQREARSASTHSVAVIEDVTAIFAKRLATSSLTAHTCGECGFTALFAERPHKLYEAYQELKAKKRKR